MKHGAHGMAIYLPRKCFFDEQKQIKPSVSHGLIGHDFKRAVKVF